MQNKAKFLSPKTATISSETEFGENVEIGPNVLIVGKCKIGDNVKVGANCIIENSVVGAGSQIVCSVIENSEVGCENRIGPFAHLRPNSKTGAFVKIGNFVEVKNSNIGDRSKAAHLAYIGDADIGEDVNIGCGAIFVNYNGKEKKRTFVGDGAFVGSNCNIIAPVKIASRSYVCAGTTVTNSTQPEDFVIGRVRQEVKPGRGRDYLKRG